jgi:hypothetical protein
VGVALGGEMGFVKIFSKAWTLAWQNKILWVFAVIPLIPTFLLQIIAFLTPSAPFTDPQNLPTEEIITFTSIYAIFSCLLGLATLFLTPISVSGMIKGIQWANSSKKVEFSKLFQSIKKYYWRVFVIPLILGIVLVVIGFVVSFAFIPFFVSGGEFSASMLPCLVPASIVAIFAFLTLAIEMIFANIAIVIDDLDVGQSFTKAWHLVRKGLWKTTSLLAILFALFFAINSSLSYGADFINKNVLNAILESLGSSTLGLVLHKTSNALITFIRYGISAVITTIAYGIWTLSYTTLKKAKIRR